MNPAQQIWILLGCAALAACQDDLAGRRCSPSEECLSGFRCRQGICVAVSAEICDGEDNNNDGFIDEDLYSGEIHPVVSVTLPSDGDLSLGAAPDGAVAAWFAVELGGVRSTFSYALVDRDGRPRGEARQVLQMPSISNAPLSVAASSTSVALVYGAPGEQSPGSLSLLLVDRDGGAGTPVPVADATAIAATRVAFTSTGPIVAYRRVSLSDFGCTDCPPGGVYVVRPGEEPLALGGGSAQGRPDLALAADGDRIAVAWTQCGLSDGGIPCGENGASPPEATVYLHTGARISIPTAAAVAVSFVPGRLLVAWQDVQAPLSPRILLRRFDEAGQPDGDPIVVDDSALQVVLPFLEIVATGSGEVGVVWNANVPGVGAQGQLLMRRMDLARGGIGRRIPVGERLAARAAHAFATGIGYGVLRAGPNSSLDFVDVHCTGVPPVEPDGGLVGGDDGGVGPPDAGTPPFYEPQGPLCITDADGGGVVSGSVRWSAGDPAVDATVVLGACRVQTDEEGRFQAAGIAAPYDASVLVNAPFGGIVGTSWTGINGAALDLVLPLESGVMNQGVVAADYQGASGRAGTLLAFLPRTVLQLDLPKGPSEQPLSWPGRPNETAIFVLIERDESFSFHAAQVLAEVTLEGGVRVDLGTILPAEQPGYVAPGTVPPANDSVVYVNLTAGGEAANLFLTDVHTGGAFGMPMPEVDPALDGGAFLTNRSEFEAGELASAATEILTRASGEVTFALPPGFALTSPGLSESGVGPAPSLGFTEAPGALFYSAQLYTTDGARFWSVHAEQPPIALPDLSAFGFAFPTGADVIWTVTARFGGPSYEMVAGGGIEPMGTWLRPGQSKRTTAPSTFQP